MSDILAVSLASADVQDAIDLAVAGDRVILPAGTISWPAAEFIVIDKAITVLGETTVNEVAGTANDLTIIEDDSTSDHPLVYLVGQAAGVSSIRGITFKPGAATGPSYVNGYISGSGAHGSQTSITGCHFIGAKQRNSTILWEGSAIGPIARNLFEYDGASLFQHSLFVKMPDWDGDTNGVGDGAWADFPWFGTNKFLFVETNYMRNDSADPIMGCIDGYFGMRLVFRYNKCFDIQLQNHGTEGRYRGARAAEVYENDFDFSTETALGGIRSGVYLYHDNRFTGTEGFGPSLHSVRTYHDFSGVLGFGGASGQNPWDVNVTEADGTHVDGNPPHVFASGTCDVGSTQGVIIDDSAPGWTPDEWIGYTVRRVSDGAISIITDNTTDTLTVTIALGGYTGELPHPVWTVGDQFEIRKVLISLDQPGRGKGDLIAGGWNNNFGFSTTTLTVGMGAKTFTVGAGLGLAVGAYLQLDAGAQVMSGLITDYTGTSMTVNVTATTGSGDASFWTLRATVNWVTGTRSWPDQALEPCYSWNNFYTGAVAKGFTLSYPPYLESDRDYYNGSNEAAAIAKYVTALNGEDYIGEYEYPHPLALEGAEDPMAAPEFTVDPVVTGTPEVGETLTSDDGTTTGNPVPTITYQWYRCTTP